MNNQKKQQDTRSGEISSRDETSNVLYFGLIDPDEFAKEEQQIDEVLETFIDYGEVKPYQSSEKAGLSDSSEGTTKPKDKKETQKTKQDFMDDTRKLIEIFNILTKGEQQTLMTFLETPAEERTEMFDLLDEYIEEVRLAELLKEIIRDYTPYPEEQKLTSENIIAHLQAQLGEHLTYFGAKENHIYLDQLRKLEPMTGKIDERLKYERNRDKDKGPPRLSDMVWPKSARKTKELKFISKEKRKKYQRLALLEQSRAKTGFVDSASKAG